MENLNTGILRRLSVPIPPQQEQRAIIDFVRSIEEQLKKTISRVEKEIDLIREYRTRLIADVVTGKSDVRAAAATLPEELEEIEPEAAEDEEVDFDTEPGGQWEEGIDAP